MQLIPVTNLFLILLPLIFVGYFYYLWVDNGKEIIYSTLRMIGQLILVGYLLTYIFKTDNWLIGLTIILFMIVVSSFIVLRNVTEKTLSAYNKIFFAITLGGSVNLWLVIEYVLEITPFYEPKFVIPIAGILYANSMDAISLAAERFEKEIKTNSYNIARKIAFKTSMIPRINSFLAVGLVALPGMMTGQILSGVDPLIAVRYQIVVMAMIFSSAGISVILYLYLLKQNKSITRTPI
jgi:putative ABC transport system permease protein